MPETDMEIPCFSCKKNFSDENDSLMNCDYCKFWFCITCLGMKQAEYKFYTKSSGMWFCAPCKIKVMKNIAESKTIEEKCNDYLQKFEKQLKSIEEMISTKCNVEEVKKIVDDKLKENFKNVNKSLNDKVDIMDEKIKENNLTWNKSLNDKVEKINEAVKESAKEVKSTVHQEKEEIIEETMQKLNEQQDKANNIIIINLEESKEILRDLIHKYDQSCVEDLMKIVLPTASCDDIFSEPPTRLGFKRADKTRPILMKFKHIDYKRAFFANIKNLGACDDELFKKSFFVHDLTDKERERERELVAEMKDKNKDLQGFIYRIRGPPHNRVLVKFTKQ